MQPPCSHLIPDHFWNILSIKRILVRENAVTKTQPLCWWPQWFHINVVFSVKRAQQRKLMVLSEIETHTHQGVKRPSFCSFHLLYPQFAESLSHEHILTRRQLALPLFYMISLLWSFSNSNNLTLKTQDGFHFHSACCLLPANSSQYPLLTLWMFYWLLM